MLFSLFFVFCVFVSILSRMMVFYCIIYVFNDVFIVKILGKVHFLFAQPVLIQRILQMPDDPDPENRVIDEPDRTQNRRDQIHRKNQIDQTENDQRLLRFGTVLSFIMLTMARSLPLMNVQLKNCIYASKSFSISARSSS